MTQNRADWADRRLVLAGYAFAVGSAVHTVDHLRRGQGSVTEGLYWAGNLALVTQVVVVTLVLTRHRTAALAAIADNACYVKYSDGLQVVTVRPGCRPPASPPPTSQRRCSPVSTALVDEPSSLPILIVDPWHGDSGRLSIADDAPGDGSDKPCRRPALKQDRG